EVRHFLAGLTATDRVWSLADREGEHLLQGPGLAVPVQHVVVVPGLALVVVEDRTVVEVGEQDRRLVERSALFLVEQVRDVLYHVFTSPSRSASDSQFSSSFSPSNDRLSIASGTVRVVADLARPDHQSTAPSSSGELAGTYESVVNAIRTASPLSVERPRRLRISFFSSTLILPPVRSVQRGAVRSALRISSSGRAMSCPFIGSSSSRRCHQAQERWFVNSNSPVLSRLPLADPDALYAWIGMRSTRRRLTTPAPTPITSTTGNAWGSLTAAMVRFAVSMVSAYG